MSGLRLCPLCYGPARKCTNIDDEDCACCDAGCWIDGVAIPIDDWEHFPRPSEAARELAREVFSHVGLHELSDGGATATGRVMRDWASRLESLPEVPVRGAPKEGDALVIENYRKQVDELLQRAETTERERVELEKQASGVPRLLEQIREALGADINDSTLQAVAALKAKLDAAIAESARLAERVAELEASGVGYSQQTVDALTTERDAQTVDNKPAPHDLPPCPKCKKQPTRIDDSLLHHICGDLNGQVMEGTEDEWRRYVAVNTPCRGCKHLPTVGERFFWCDRCPGPSATSYQHTPAEWIARNKGDGDESHAATNGRMGSSEPGTKTMDDQADSGVVRPVGGRVLGPASALPIHPADPVCGSDDSVPESLRWAREMLDKAYENAGPGTYNIRATLMHILDYLESERKERG